MGPVDADGVVHAVGLGTAESQATVSVDGRPAPGSSSSRIHPYGCMARA
jgi:hypothetical protein